MCTGARLPLSSLLLVNVFIIITGPITDTTATIFYYNCHWFDMFLKFGRKGYDVTQSWKINERRWWNQAWYALINKIPYWCFTWLEYALCTIKKMEPKRWHNNVSHLTGNQKHFFWRSILFLMNQSWVATKDALCLVKITPQHAMCPGTYVPVCLHACVS